MIVLLRINKERYYENIIDLLCKIKKIPKNEIFKILKDRNCKYLFFLLVKKYECMDLLKLKEDFNIKNKKSAVLNMRKACEKFLINNDFRQMFFEADDMLNNEVKKTKKE